MKTRAAERHAIKNKLGRLSLFLEIAKAGYRLSEDDQMLLVDIRNSFQEFLSESDGFEAPDVFNSIGREYEFFQKYSTSHLLTIQMMIPVLSPYLNRSGCRFFDFGCGDGTFTAQILEKLASKNHKVEFSILDTDPTCPPKAQTQLSSYSQYPIKVRTKIDTKIDIGISNHALYHVPNIVETLLQIYNRMSRNSKFAIVMANIKHDLPRLQKDLSEFLGDQMPKYFAEDVQYALKMSKIEFTSKEITSEFSFADTLENRRLALRLINRGQVVGMSKERELINTLSNYKVDTRICMSVCDTVFVIGK